MTYVQSGTTLTWVGTFAGDSFVSQSSVDAINQVQSALRNKYNLVVTSVDDETDPNGAGTVSLDLRTDMDRGDGSSGANDIQSNVDDEFALAGSACVSSTITNTGAPPATVGSTPSSGGGGASYDTCSTLTDKFRNALPTWLGGTPVTDSQQACYTKQNQAQIQSVASNAAQAYGPGSTTAQVAQQEATKQAALSATDTATLAQQARDAAKKADESQKNTLLIVGAIAAGVIVLVVIMPYVLPRS